MVEEFKKFSMEVVGISETKWFGQDMYDVGGFLILHSWRPVPGAGERVEQGCLPHAQGMRSFISGLECSKGWQGWRKEWLVAGDVQGALLERLMQLFHQVWACGEVPQEWRDALIVPIPKGDLSVCDNWRGISLLDIGGKLFGKIIQKRLQEVAEVVLLDSQCGFRRGRGCVDMIFCARQIIEKSIEHDTKTFILFVDLRKAYDSVPRQALWHALESYGIPEPMLRLIRSLHDGMKAEVTVEGKVAPDIEVRNGLRQGCVLAPTLFNLYFNLVIRQWRERCREFGVEVLYN